MFRPALFVLALLCVAPLIADDNLRVSVGSHELEFSPQTGTPVRWVSCYPECSAADARQTVWFAPGDGGMQWRVETDAAAAKILQDSGFDLSANDSGEYVEVAAVSEESLNGEPVELLYRIPKSGYTLSLRVNAAVDLRLAVATGNRFTPPQLPGFMSIYSSVRGVFLEPGNLSYFESDELQSMAQDMHQDSWLGARNRYWTLLVNPVSQTHGQLEFTAENAPQFSLLSPPDSHDMDFRLYAGPIEPSALTAVNPALKDLLFSAIWDWLRLISFGMLYLLDGLYELVGNYGLAIILLSLSVKVLMYPLTYIADKWQAQVNATSSMLKPKLDAIKRNYKGEEAHNKVLAVYKEHDVHPMYTIRSLFGFLIQIPVFIAAFDMLGENFLLGQASFLWIADLSVPDQLTALPFSMPFFGGYLNLLPFAMTALTILSAIVQQEDDLTPDLMRQQRIKLFAMAAAFFVLFYTFPAGMVLYWTANNLFHLLKILPSRFISSGR